MKKPNDVLSEYVRDLAGNDVVITPSEHEVILTIRKPRTPMKPLVVSLLDKAEAIKLRDQLNVAIERME